MQTIEDYYNSSKILNRLGGVYRKMGRYKEALARLKNLGEAENISDSYREGTFRVPQT